MTSVTLVGVGGLWLALLITIQVSKAFVVPVAPISKNIGAAIQQICTKTFNGEKCQYVFQRTHVFLEQSVRDSLNEVPSTTIEEGTILRAETLSSSNSIVVSGQLEILDYLECERNLQVTKTGRILGDVIAPNGVVTVDGDLQGSAKCEKLIVGPTGKVAGDVHCFDLITRPGGKIGGNISCESMKSERDVFHHVRYPLEEESPLYDNTRHSYRFSAQNNTTVNITKQPSEPEPADAVVHSQPKFELDVTSAITDEVGNPLIGAASDDQVESYRKNREKIFATRNFLDKYIVPGSNKPILINNNASDSNHKPNQDRASTKSVRSPTQKPDDSYYLNKKKQSVRAREMNSVILAARGEPLLPTPSKKRSTTRIFATTCDILEKSPTVEKELTNARSEGLTTKASNDQSGPSSTTGNNEILPSFLRIQTHSRETPPSMKRKISRMMISLFGRFVSFFSSSFYKGLNRYIFFWKESKY